VAKHTVKGGGLGPTPMGGVAAALDATGRAYVTPTFKERIQVYEGLSPAAPPE